MESFKEYLQNIDILSIEPSMKVNGNSRFTTLLGKILSIICILTICIMSLIILVDVLARKNYIIIYNVDNREIPVVQLNTSQITLLITDAMGREIDQYDRYYNLMVKFWKIDFPKIYNNITNQYERSTMPKTTITDIPLRKCSELKYKRFSYIYEIFSRVHRFF